MDREKYDHIIDEVYQTYLENHKEEFFIMSDEVDLTREEFIEKAKTSHGFGSIFGISLKELELSLEERETLYRKHCMENFWALKLNETNEAHYERANIPTKKITLEYKGEKIVIYE